MLITGARDTEGQRGRTRRGINALYHPSPEDVIAYLREQAITLTYDPAARTLHAGTGDATPTIALKAS